MSRSTLFTLALTTLAAGPLSAQTADLRYTAPQPVRVSYSSVDSMKNMMSNSAAGDMNMTGVTNSTTELELTGAGDDISVNAVVKDLSGSVNTPMGSMDMPLPAGPLSIAFKVTARGPDPTDAQNAGLPDMMSPEASGEMLARTRAMMPLVYLPGRSVRVGESWTDTIPMNMAIDGAQSEGTTVVRGTYQRDTVVEGRTLNVIDMRTVMQMKVKGNIQGMDMDQTIDSEGTTLLLWDSARHLPWLHDTSTTMSMKASVSGMDMSISGSTRAITRQVQQ